MSLCPQVTDDTTIAEIRECIQHLLDAHRRSAKDADRCDRLNEAVDMLRGLAKLMEVDQ
jgi:hypothetical protein